MGVIRSILTMAFAVVAQQVWTQEVRAQAVSAPTVETILAHPRVVKTLEDIKADDDRAFAEQKHITEIPAPPYKEKLRAEYYQKRMLELGFKDASIDSEGNVIALRKGTGGGRPKLVVSAHLDTVFPEGTDVTVKEKDGAILAPGIGDDSRGLAALLSLIKAMNANEISTVGDILFVGTVGEEELGNLRGVKALFRDHTDIDGFISIDGLGITRVVNQGTGSHRYEFTFRGARRSLLPGVRPAQRDPRHGPRDRQNLRSADAVRSQDHVHRRHCEWRHIGQRHRCRGADGGRYAFGLD
jgi:tripeptide aminopeptidase